MCVKIWTFAWVGGKYSNWSNGNGVCGCGLGSSVRRQKLLTGCCEPLATAGREFLVTCWKANEGS
jgi:hypothetical protein